jgi:hypothetical protein
LWKEEFDLFSRIFSVSAIWFESLASLSFVAAATPKLLANAREAPLHKRLCLASPILFPWSQAAQGFLARI